ncbi:MAG TPA: SBBP repeat-containing protein, partial [Candidatus Binatia bacterium]|nr:SBBP repeat-containing protein [Candidatus Binatia bacterium]
MSKLGVLAGWIGIALVVNAAPVQQVWEARYNGPLNREDLFSAMTIDAAGRVYVTGSSDNNANPDPYATVKYDTNGVQTWVARYTGPRQVDVPIAIAVDNAGNVYVTGFSHGTVHNYDPDYATVKYAPDGTELWAARYNAHTNAVSSADIPRAMVINNAGEVYVTGASASPQGSMDFLTIKYSTTGSELWVQRYDGPAHSEDAGRAMGIDAAGNIHVCGSSPGILGTWDITLIKYSPGGTQMWVSRFETEVFGRLDELAMAVDAAGNSYISVFTKQPGPSWVWRLNLLKYDANGGLVWKTQRRAVSEDEYISIAAMELDDANNVC